MGQADTSRTAAHLPRAAADDSADARACLSTAGRFRPGAAALTTGPHRQDGADRRATGRVLVPHARGGFARSDLDSRHAASAL